MGLFECTEYVVAVGVDEQQQEEQHSGVLCVFHDFFIGLAARDDLVEQEHHVASVKSGYGNYVHERKSYRKKCRYLPESIPVPFFREQAADGSESADALRTLGCEHVFHGADVVGHSSGAVFPSFGE